MDLKTLKEAKDKVVQRLKVKWWCSIGMMV